MKVMSVGFCILACAALPLRASDHLVDASGAQSALTNLTQAMAVAVPGDRIFVLPGNYPAFHFSRGVEVIGLGASPSAVTIARVDFHPTAPVTDFDAALSNVTVCSASLADSISIGGNELAEGTLTLEGVATCGGVYLRGAGDFYLLVVDSRFEPGAGGGFLGAALDFGGGIADIVDTRISGPDADATLPCTAGVGARIAGGATVRISGSEITGGNGADSPRIALSHGARAIERGFGAAHPKLRLAGNTLVAGGNGGTGGHGGAGVSLIGEIRVGAAIVRGGSGARTGAAYDGGSPVHMPFDPLLTMDPPKAFAAGDAFFRAPSTITVQAGDAFPSFWMGYALFLDRPSTATLSPLAVDKTIPIEGPSFTLHANGTALGGIHGAGFTRRRVYVQGFYRASEGGPIESTNPVAVTIALD